MGHGGLAAAWFACAVAGILSWLTIDTRCTVKVNCKLKESRQSFNTLNYSGNFMHMSFPPHPPLLDHA
jgi:hypothetical protein